MKEQNFRNHRRLVPLYHGFTLLALIAFFIGSLRNLIYANEQNVYDAALLVLAAFILASLYIYARVFALRVQDRAIRAEENFRYFILTGKRLDPRIRLRQLIALRFASDEEFPALAEKAVNEGLAPTDIKKQIKKWRSDWHRV